jgi:hypothetical protein
MRIQYRWPMVREEPAKTSPFGMPISTIVTVSHHILIILDYS